MKIIHKTLLALAILFLHSNSLTADINSELKSSNNPQLSCLIYNPDLGVVKDNKNLDIQSDEFEITKDPDIEDDMALPPLLLQPFVENAIIHGIVPKKMRGLITIDFKLEGEKLVCTVTDDGIGINRSKKLKEASVTVHKSMALEITRKRLEVIQAVTSRSSHVEIKEILNTIGEPAGTRIILNLPVQYANN